MERAEINLSALMWGKNRLDNGSALMYIMSLGPVGYDVKYFDFPIFKFFHKKT